MRARPTSRSSGGTGSTTTRDEIGDRRSEHLQLTVIAVGIGFVVSWPCRSSPVRWRRTYGPITWITGLLYTIPSLALFAFLLVPFTGLGTTTAEIGLVSYTLLILVRNIVAGVDGVPAGGTEAADGMGYRRGAGSCASTSAWPRRRSSPGCASPRSPPSASSRSPR